MIYFWTIVAALLGLVLGYYFGVPVFLLSILLFVVFLVTAWIWIFVRKLLPDKKMKEHMMRCLQEGFLRMNNEAKSCCYKRINYDYSKSKLTDNHTITHVCNVCGNKLEYDRTD